MPRGVPLFFSELLFRKINSFFSIFVANIMNMDIKKKFALTISYLRLTSEEKVTQQQVADYCGITVRHYYDLEKGNKQPTLTVMASIAGFYKMKLSKLCKMVEEREE